MSLQGKYWLLLILLVSAPGMALETRCVDTVAELDDAVRIATDDDVEIHLVQGTYDIAGTILNDFAIEEPEPDDDLSIIGGYAPGCGSRSLDPYSTTLESSAVLEGIYISGGDNSGNIRFESLRLQGFDTNIYLGGGFSDGYTFTLSRVVVEDGSIGVGASNINISNSVFTGYSGANCVLDLGLYSFSLNMSHSVVADNDNGGFSDALCLDTFSSSWDAVLVNNIFWNNGGDDIYTDSPGSETDLTLINNIRQSLNLSEPLSTPEVGGLNQNPQFSNAPGAPFRPVSASPAVNSGTVLASSAIAQDIDGGPRWVGSAPDRGAYESNVDDTNGLEVTTVADLISPLIVGSLRWAITQSNSDPDTNTISFNIPGGCPRIIDLVAPLPDITDRVIIDGYTQPGSTPPSSGLNFNANICIGVRGDLSTNHAFQIPLGTPESESLNVSGIGFGGFDVGAIRLTGGGGSWIHGNQFGGSLDGVALGNSAVNVRIGGTSNRNLVGGEETELRNLIMFGWSAGIQLLENSGGTDGYENYVVNNFIGADASGQDSAPNALGILVRTHDNHIEDNVISGNLGHGILIEGTLADDNYVVGNRIGLKSYALCSPQPCQPDFALGNSDMGILVQGGGSENYIGFNTVAYNASKGIRLFEGQRNKLLHNLVYSNASLGIDLGVAGVNPSYNAGDPATANLPNRGINAPVILDASGGRNKGRIQGVFTSSNGSYVLQSFRNDSCDESGRGEGKAVLGTALIEIDNQPSGGNGNVVFDIPVETSFDLQTRFVTATVTDASGNSSEFSNCEAYDCDTIFAHGMSGSGETCATP